MNYVLVMVLRSGDFGDKGFLLLSANRIPVVFSSWGEKP